MSGPASRRGFLSGLATLPLIGGSVALIGSPSAVAEPISARLLTDYETWLACELHQLSREVHPESPVHYMSLYTPAWDWHDERVDLVRPSTRAALVLSAVGCDWREGAR